MLQGCIKNAVQIAQNRNKILFSIPKSKNCRHLSFVTNSIFTLPLTGIESSVLSIGPCLDGSRDKTLDSRSKGNSSIPGGGSIFDVLLTLYRLTCFRLMEANTHQHAQVKDLRKLKAIKKNNTTTCKCRTNFK